MLVSKAIITGCVTVWGVWKTALVLYLKTSSLFFCLGPMLTRKSIVTGRDIECGGAVLCRIRHPSAPFCSSLALPGGFIAVANPAAGVLFLFVVASLLLPSLLGIRNRTSQYSLWNK